MTIISSDLNRAVTIAVVCVRNDVLICLVVSLVFSIISLTSTALITPKNTWFYQLLEVIDQPLFWFSLGGIVEQVLTRWLVERTLYIKS